MKEGWYNGYNNSRKCMDQLVKAKIDKKLQKNRRFFYLTI